MAEKRLTIDSAEPLLLFGFNDTYLRRIEAAFPDTQITARGTTVVVRGEEDRIARIEQVLAELVMILGRNGNLTQNDVDTVLAITALGEEGGEAARPLLGARDVILFTPTGGMVKAKTPGQQRLVEVARKNDVVFAIGPAGTGKTYSAVALAVAALKSRQVKRVVLSRPAVEAGERLGFLPGDLRDKIDPYLRPLYDALEEMMTRERLKMAMEDGTVEIAPLGFMRGRTLSNAFVILDEAQNATVPQMKMFLTRLGSGSRAIVTGDATQTDLPSRDLSGLLHARAILDGIEGIGVVEFSKNDVVRHRLVREIVDAYERDGHAV